ncbi:hypothetical protein J0692_22865 [Vibrio alginolyticus]|uniref:hypothetical protein n=1 Tax=Vibrio alginolyticus TaxID=663 RepID=UPI001A90830A|nr:hypothetical protein [Vibrio alginolyticus]MBO0165095.1 hypothetical protein [Vibrio alginolyticus]
MSLEQQVANLVDASNKLTGAVNGKMTQIDKKVDDAIAELTAASGNQKKTVWVSMNGSDSNDGSSEDKAYLTFSKAFYDNRQHTLIVCLPAGEHYVLNTNATYYNSVLVIISSGDTDSFGYAKITPVATWMPIEDHPSTFEHGWRSTSFIPANTNAVLIVSKIDTETFNPNITEDQKHISGRSALFARSDYAMNSVVIHDRGHAKINQGMLFGAGSGTTITLGFKMRYVDYEITPESAVAITGYPRKIFFNEDYQPMLVTIDPACSITDGYEIKDFILINNNESNIVSNYPARLGLGAL